MTEPGADHDSIDEVRAILAEDRPWPWYRTNLEEVEQAVDRGAGLAAEDARRCRPLVTPLVETIVTAVTSEYSTAESMVADGKRYSVVRKATELLATVVAEVPDTIATVSNEVATLGATLEDRAARSTLKELIDSVAATDANSLRPVVAEYQTWEKNAPPGDQARMFEILGWIGYRHQTLVEPALPTLVAALDNDSAPPKVAAAEALAMITDAPDQTAESPPAELRSQAATVAGVLQDDQADARTAATATLANVGVHEINVVIDWTEELVTTLLSSEDSQTRSEAGRALRTVARERPAALADHIERLAEGLRAEPADIPSRCAKILERVAESDPGIVAEAVPALVSVVVNSDPDSASHPARIEAAKTLGTVGRTTPGAISDVVDRLVAGLTADEGGTREQCATVIWQTAETDPELVARAVPDLVTLVLECPRARIDSGWALAEIGRNCPGTLAAELDRLRDGLTAETGPIRVLCTRILAETAETDAEAVGEAAPELMTVMLDTERAHADARLALERIVQDDPRALAKGIDRLRKGLTAEEPAVRKRCAELARQTARTDPAVVAVTAPQLATVIRETDRARRDAALSLERIGGEQPAAVARSLDQLQGGLTADAADVRRRCAEVLAETAAADAGAVVDAVPDLIAVVADAGPRCEAAAQALQTVWQEHPETIEGVDELRGAITTGRGATDEVLRVLIVAAESDPEALEPLVPELAAVLDHRDPAVRRHALVILRRVGEQAPDRVVGAAGEIATAVETDDHDVTVEAAKTMDVLVDRSPAAFVETVPQLRELLRDGRLETDTRLLVVDVLRRIGTRAVRGSDRDW